MNGIGEKNMETNIQDISETIERVLFEYGATGLSPEVCSSLGYRKYSARLPASFSPDGYFALCDSLRHELGDAAVDVTISEGGEICIFLFPGDNTYTGADISPDELLHRAAAVSVMAGGASAPLLQRMLGIGYGRAAELMEKLAGLGIISAPNGGYGEVLICESEFYERFEK